MLHYHLILLIFLFSPAVAISGISTADINVQGHTQLNGALLATVDEDDVQGCTNAAGAGCAGAAGNDLNNLNLSTNTISFEHLSNTDYSSNQSAGLSASLNLGKKADQANAGNQDPNKQTNPAAKPSDKQDAKQHLLGNPHLQYNNTSNQALSKTLATLGMGNIQIAQETDLAGLNRNSQQTELTIFNVDRTQGDIDMTVDTRLFTEAGREQIKEDIKESKEYTQDIVTAVQEVTERDDLGLRDYWKTLNNNINLTDWKGEVMSDSELMKLLTSQDPTERQKGAQQASMMAQSQHGISAEDASQLYFYDASDRSIGHGSFREYDAAEDKKGGFVREGEYANTILVDVGDKVSDGDVRNTIGHETYEGITYLNGEVNDDKQEAFSEAYGTQYSRRLNEAIAESTGIDYSHRYSTVDVMQGSRVVIQGNERARLVGHSEVDFRQLHAREAGQLDQVRQRIRNSDLSLDEQSIALLQLNAVACNQVSCANGVSKDDPHYQHLHALQQQGAELKEQGISLDSLIDDLPQDLFQYSVFDRVQDKLTQREEDIERAKGAVNMIIGGFGTAMSGTAAVTTAPACTSVIGCAIPVGLTAFTSLTAAQAYHGTTSLFGDYSHTHGQRVIDSFSLDSHSGNYHIYADGAINMLLWGAETIALNKVSNLIPSKVKDKVGEAIGGGGRHQGSDNNVNGNRTADSGAQPTVYNQLNQSVFAPNLTERGTLTNIRPNDPAVLQATQRILVQDSSGRYWLQGPSGNRITPSGSYDFVTLSDGTIRVARPNTNPEYSTHLGLSGGNDVKFAGSIRFSNNSGANRGNITNWSNDSGHYQPPAGLADNAGLPSDSFNPH